jgi:hypothetical protein
MNGHSMNYQLAYRIRFLEGDKTQEPNSWEQKLQERQE